MKQKSPTIRENILFYSLHSEMHSVRVGSEEWYTWLINATIFVFESPYGTFTAHKEQSGSKRGGWYWKAYRRYKGKLYRVYLGKAEDMTLEHLQQTAATLSTRLDVSALSAEDVPVQTTSAFFLETKLHIPYTHTELLTRSRLIEQLNKDVSPPIVLLTAPAGFGKTALLSSWLRHDEHSVAWVSLDEGDNDLVRFLTYIIASLERTHVPIGESTLLLVHSPQRPSLEVILTTLIQEIAVVPNTLTLLLDDYHMITSQSIHDVLLFLLDHLPLNMHVVIASRSDLPLPLSRWRVRGLLTEIRMEELRFTLDEAAVFLRQIMGLTLSPEEIALLETRTEGWVAGLQLAALSLREHYDSPRFLQGFAGTNRYVADYLIEEVLERLPQEVQSFLYRTSVLDRLSGPLCDALLNIEDVGKPSHGRGQSMLEHLDREHLFLVPLDDERQWYRYHHLFLSFLRSRLHSLHADWILPLHRQASTWYAENALQDEAVGHALMARDWEWAASLLEQVAPMVLMRGELTTLLSWFQAFPKEIIRQQPELLIPYAWALVFSGQVDDAEPRMQDAGNLLKTLLANEMMTKGKTFDDVRGLQGEVAALGAMIALTRGEIAHTIDLACQALEWLPERNLVVRCVAALTLGSAYRMTGDISAASHAFAEAIMAGQATGNILVTLLASQYMAQLQREQGHLHKAAEIYKNAFQYAVEGMGKQVPTVGLLYIGLSEILFEWNDLDAASSLLLHGLELGTLCDAPEVLLAGSMTLAQVKYAQGKLPEVLAPLETVEKLMQRVTKSSLLSEIAAQRTHLQLQRHDTASAIRWAQECGLQSADELRSSSGSVEYLTLARTYVVQGQFDKALDLLSRLQQQAERSGSMHHVLAILVVRAITIQAQGNISEALITVKQALALAEPEGYIRVFIAEGVPMAHLLQRAAAQGIFPHYIHQLLAAFPAHTEGFAVHDLSVGTSPLFELLHEREHEVLHLVARGMSNQEIAQALVISLGTVKTHINNIFRKLDVHTRTQALARAKELHLLSL